MRIGAFKATNFRHLEKKLADFPWELFLSPGAMPTVQVASKQSRLYHKTAIGERCISYIAARLSRFSLQTESDMRSDASPKIFIRVVNDHFSLSIDSSGDNLHKRGLKKDVGRAPLRETIAAAILRLAGYCPEEPLLDPMCGSGTFSLEAAMIAKNLPAGWFRDFSFMGWPCFRSQRWEYIKRSAQTGILEIAQPVIFASDKDQAACEALQRRVAAHDLGGVVRVFCSDFFDISPADFADRPGLVVLNPPYGVRLGTTRQSAELFQAICRQLGLQYRDWKVALIVPPRFLTQSLPLNLTRRSICHGGLQLRLLLGRIP